MDLDRVNASNEDRVNALLSSTTRSFCSTLNVCSNLNVYELCSKIHSCHHDMEARVHAFSAAKKATK